jgi:signal transduction histidine kinase
MHKVFYPNSEVHLRIYKEDTKLIFSVSDNGIGFNLTREDLFKKFTKWANSELQMKAQRELVVFV